MNKKQQIARLALPPATSLLILIAAASLNTSAHALEPPPITPIDEFYILGLAPEIPQDWQLIVTGEVDNTLFLSLEDIKSMPPVNQISTLECFLEIGEDSKEKNAAIKSYADWIAAHIEDTSGRTKSWNNRAGGLLVSSANWTGVRLNDILAQAGLRGTAASVVFSALDGYEISVLLDQITARNDILLAYEMNGQPLPLIQGSPLKLVLPGIAGYQNVRWLKRITVLDSTFAGSLVHYNVHARILKPLRLTTHPVGTQTISGMAYVGLAKEIAKVDISIDHGQTWLPTEILSYHMPNVWKHWRAEIEITEPNSYKVFARAEDTLGNVQISGIGYFGWEGFGVPFDVDLDTDSDQVANAIDNCPAISNPSQTDSDADGIGNACDPSCPNLDSLNPVNFADLSIIAQNWGQTGPDILGDLNDDNTVDANDIDALAAHWLADCYE